MTRLAGITAPLSALRSEKSLGVGDISDLVQFARFAKRVGFGVVQILPPYELARGETSPYGARTAFGLDPIYVDLRQIPDLGAADIERFEADAIPFRDAELVDFNAARDLKLRALRIAFDRFFTNEWQKRTERALHLAEFVAEESSWERDLSLYVALRTEHNEHAFQYWPKAEADRDPVALQAARMRLARDVLFHQYAQWQTFVQWDQARKEIAAIGVMLMGDLPFVVAKESADVWTHRSLFLLERELGAPPDEFDPEDGQAWGLPPYDWEVLDATGLGWIRRRVSHAARLYDAFRIDHVIGYFRQYVRLPKALGDFDPKDEKEQERHGERLLRATLDAADGARVIAEDLGVIPPFARKVLEAMGLPGYKVIPWEKVDPQTMRDPATFSPTSVATWSTHDTPPFLEFWDAMAETDKKQLAKLAGGPTELDMFGLLFGCPSELVLLLLPELLGQRARINTPGTVGPENWSYRLPCTIDDLETRYGDRLRSIGTRLRAKGRT